MRDVITCGLPIKELLPPLVGQSTRLESQGTVEPGSQGPHSPKLPSCKLSYQVPERRLNLHHLITGDPQNTEGDFIGYTFPVWVIKSSSLTA